MGKGMQQTNFQRHQIQGTVRTLFVQERVFPSFNRFSCHGNTQHDLSHIPGDLPRLDSLFLAYVVAWGSGLFSSLKKGRLATFIQSSFHGNLGYIGFAVAYYMSGVEGFARAGIIAGFMMIAQNFLAVVALSVNSGSSTGRNSIGGTISKIIGNPVISAAMAGIIFSMPQNL